MRRRFATITVSLAAVVIVLLMEVATRGNETASLAAEVLTQNADIMTRMPPDARRKLQTLMQRDPGVWETP